MCHSRTLSVIPAKAGIQAGLDPASPFCHSRENGNPGRTGSRIKCGMTRGLSVEDDKGVE